MSNLELELWDMLGEALKLAKPSNDGERAKLDAMLNRYGFICDEMDDEEEADLALLEDISAAYAESQEADEAA